VNSSRPVLNSRSLSAGPVDVKPTDNSVRKVGGCWLSPLQENLLHACLKQGEPAMKAWDAWRAEADLDTVENRLNKMERMVKIGDKSVMILKGAPLAVAYYRDIGLRCMSDFDVLVPPEETETVISIIKELGWQVNFGRFEDLTDTYRKYRHSQGFAYPPQYELDLHWHLMYTSLEAGADDDFWAEAVPVSLGRREVLTLNATDHLLHACAHGVWWNTLPPLRWIADAVTILNSGAEINWDRILEQTRRRQLTLPIKAAMEYLKYHMNAQVPDSLLHDLAVTRLSIRERNEYKAWIIPDRARGPWNSFWYYYSIYSRANRDVTRLRRITGFPGYLKILWKTEKFRDVPVQATVRILRRIRNVMESR